MSLSWIRRYRIRPHIIYEKFIKPNNTTPKKLYSPSGAPVKMNGIQTIAVSSQVPRHATEAFVVDQRFFLLNGPRERFVKICRRNKLHPYPII